jgi:hypothetical protein
MGVGTGTRLGGSPSSVSTPVARIAVRQSRNARMYRTSSLLYRPARRRSESATSYPYFKQEPLLEPTSKGAPHVTVSAMGAEYFGKSVSVGASRAPCKCDTAHAGRCRMQHPERPPMPSACRFDRGIGRAGDRTRRKRGDAAGRAPAGGLPRRRGMARRGVNWGRGMRSRRVSWRLGERRPRLLPGDSARAGAAGMERGQAGPAVGEYEVGIRAESGVKSHHKPHPVCTTNQNQGLPAPCLVLCAMPRGREGLANPRMQVPMRSPPLLSRKT